MALANFDLDFLRDKIREAYKTDDPVLSRFRDYAKRLRDSIKPLKTYSVNAVSFVSADGGDNRLTFNPAVIELVRVVDSRGIQCALDAVPGTATLDDIKDRAVPGTKNSVSPLVRLCDDLGKSLGDMSYLIRGLGKPGKSTGAMRTYRDIVEWAVLYDLMTNTNLQWGGDTILVRDGLLRTKSFTRHAFPILDRKLREASAAHANRNVSLSIVGVAKHSAVLSKLSLALELEAVFARPYPCFVKVPPDIEGDCYNFDNTWLTTYEAAEEDAEGERLYQSMGHMYLVKFGDGPFDPVWPVDIAEWQIKDVEKILGQLTVDAQQGFPIPDYPMCIQKAHDFAKMTGLEVEVLQDMLVQMMTEKLSAEEVERLLRLKHLGQTLASLRYKEA